MKAWSWCALLPVLAAACTTFGSTGSEPAEAGTDATRPDGAPLPPGVLPDAGRPPPDGATLDGALVTLDGSAPEDGGNLPDGATGDRDARGTLKRAFVTTDAYKMPQVPGALGMDARCAAEATANSLGGVWMAWVPDGLSNFTADRFVAAGMTGPWFSMDPTPTLLATLDGLKVGTILRPINLGPSGTTRLDAFVWTGTLATGQASGSSCGGWLLTTGNATVGRSFTAGPGWTNELQSSAAACASTDNHLYCFER